ncbi:MAG: AMP-binding protein [Nitrososphaerales archaeon]
MDNDFVWTPSAERVARSNLKRLMDAQDIRSFEDLRLKSIRDPEWFWDAVARDLEIEWFNPYSRVLDVSDGIQWARWFAGGKINIAHNCVDKHLSSSANNIALISESEDSLESRKLTYAELGELTNQIANTLVDDFKLTRGDKVGIYLPMTPEAVASFLAVAKIGGVVVPIFSGYGAQAISTRLEDCESKAIITADRFFRRGKEVKMAEVAREAALLSSTVRSILVYETSKDQMDTNPSDKLKTFSWKRVLSKSREFNAQVMNSEDPFMIIYTSGTTGKPKGAVHVHGGFQVKIAEEVAYQADLHERDILFWFTDLGWIMAPWEIVGALSLGGTVLIYDGAPDYPTPSRLWEVIERNKVTIFGVSPTLIRALMKYGIEPVRKHNLTSLNSFASTGEPWNPESYDWLFESVGERRCPIVNLSGGTEVGACFLSVHPIVPIKRCSLGGPCLGIDADVVDEGGNPVRGKTGELVIRNPWPSMTRGLWKNRELYLENYWSRFKDVWVHGDWASIDSDGYWFLHGRSDDTIKVAGKRVGPAEIESVLSSHERVLESVAIGTPDPLKGETIVCFVVLRPGATPAEELRRELIDHVGRAIGPTMKPREVVFVGALPKTRNAKLVRRLVRASYLGLPLGDVSNLENPESLESISNAK